VDTYGPSPHNIILRPDGLKEALTERRNVRTVFKRDSGFAHNGIKDVWVRELMRENGVAYALANYAQIVVSFGGVVQIVDAGSPDATGLHNLEHRIKLV
jgi:ABC-type uncharacterized transport system substrate-binding protein